MIIDTSNAPCGPGFLPGLRLSEGRSIVNRPGASPGRGWGRRRVELLRFPFVPPQGQTPPIARWQGPWPGPAAEVRRRRAWPPLERGPGDRSAPGPSRGAWLRAARGCPWCPTGCPRARASGALLRGRLSRRGRNPSRRDPGERGRAPPGTGPGPLAPAGVPGLPPPAVPPERSGVFFPTTTSDQTWRPAEFKHITKRRKRN